MTSRMEKVFNFDVNRFIEEIRLRPVLYDQSHEHFTTQEIKQEGWLEVVQVCLGGDKDISQAEKRDLIPCAQKRWKNMRDTYVRERRLRMSGNPKAKKRKYIYEDRLRFLLDVIKITPRTLGNPRNVQKAGQVMNSIVSDPKEGRTIYHSSDKHKSTAETQAPPFVQPQNVMTRVRPRVKEAPDEDGDKLFLLSLLGDLKRIPEQLKLEAKCELMTVINKYLSHKGQGHDPLSLVTMKGEQGVAECVVTVKSQDSSEESN